MNCTKSFKTKALYIALLCLVTSLGHAKYTFGKKQQWTISGYSKLKIQAKNHHSTELELDELSLFFSANINQWINPFLEIELFSIPIWESDDGFQFNNAEFIVERLYNDFKIDNGNTVRLGKFLSPLNRWNLNHAAPLVWTVNRPMTTRFSFSTFITGIKYRHNFNFLSGQALDFYWQPYQEFDPKPLTKQARNYQSIAGITWTVQDDLSNYFALSIQHDNVKNINETRTTASFDFSMQKTLFEIEGQLLFTLVENDLKKHHQNDWGGYIQTVFPIPLDLNIVTRYEHFEFSNQSKTSDIALVGLTYRPQPDISLKLEWQQTWGSTWRADTGLFTSFAVLF